MRRRVAFSLIALVLAGCGSGNGSGSSSSNRASSSSTHQATSPPSQAPAPKVARQFLAAAKRGHGAQACALMTDRAVSKTARYVASTGHAKSHRARNCAIYFMAYQTPMQGTLTTLRIGQVKVHGPRTRAEVICPICRPKFRHLRPLTLQETAAGWRVDFNFRRGY